MEHRTPYSPNTKLLRERAAIKLQEKLQSTPLPERVEELQQRLRAAELRAIELELLHEEELHHHHEETEFQSFLLGAVGQAIIATDTSGIITYWNPAAEKLYGWTAEEVIGRNVIEVTPSHATKEQAEEIMSALMQKKSWAGEFWVQRRDGTIFPAHVFDAPILDSSGALIGIIGISHDITEQKQHEEYLLRINQVLSDFQKAIQQVSIVSKTDKRGVITYFNDKFVKISGYTSSELIGQKHSIINSGHHPKQFWVDMWKTIASGKQWHGEVQNKAKDGSYYWVDTFIIPLLDDHGEIREFLSIRNDITERKHIEHEFSTQHRLMRTIAETLPSLVGYWTSDLRCTFANKGYLEWFGKTTEEMSGITIQELMGETLFRKNEPYIHGALRGEKQQFERTLIKANGEVSYTWAQYIPDITNGVVHGFVAVILDITEIKKIQINLNQAQHLAHIGSWEWDTVNDTIKWSDEEYLLYGEDILSYTPTRAGYLSHLSAEEAKKTKAALRKALEGKEPFAREHEIIRPDGTTRYVFEQATVMFDTAQKPIMTFGTTQDITERKEAEEKIRQSEANLRAIMDSSIQAFWLTDTELRVKAFNRVTQQNVQSLFGREIVIGDSILNYVLPKQQERFIECAQRALEGEAIIYEESFTMEFGEEQWSELMYLPTHNAEGNIIGLTLSSFNITERKLAYQELEKMNVTLEERVAKRTQELVLVNKEKDEFLGIAAHDLKNPLAGILSSAEIINRYFVDDSTEHFTKMIISASNQMLDIITNLLDVNRIETGMLDLHLEAVNLNLLDSIVKEYQVYATQKGILLHYEKPVHNAAWVQGDRQSLCQIFDNLLSNAVKYSPRWTNVRIRILPNILNPDGSVTRVEIQDEGPGLTDEDKKKLFGKFARLSAQPTGGENSTGLGLSIVKKLVELQNGHIWCESTFGKGATFIVELPSVHNDAA